jgi:hypothetical protein
MKRGYRFWTKNEIALIRSTILNGGLQSPNSSDLTYLSNILNRSVGSIACKVGREKMTLGLSPQGFTGKTIGYNPVGPILV